MGKRFYGNNGKITEMSNKATQFKKGEPRPKNAGKKLGFVSLKTTIDLMFKKLTKTKDGKPISYKDAMILKAIHKATVEGDIRAMEFLANRSEGAPKATLDLSVKELPAPLLNGESNKNIPV
jgi:hypothetical protein